MPSSRLSLRLGQLPHDVLAELAARLCSDSPALQAIAEECMAAHKPLSHELVERVLLLWAVCLSTAFALLVTKLVSCRQVSE